MDNLINLQQQLSMVKARQIELETDFQVKLRALQQTQCDLTEQIKQHLLIAASRQPNGLLMIPNDVLHIILALHKISCKQSHIRPTLQLTCKRLAAVHFAKMSTMKLYRNFGAVQHHFKYELWLPMPACDHLLADHRLFAKDKIRAYTKFVDKWSMAPLTLELSRTQEIKNLSQYFNRIGRIRRPVHLMLNDPDLYWWQLQEFVKYIDLACECDNIQSITIAKIAIIVHRPEQSDNFSDNYNAVRPHRCNQWRPIDLLKRSYLPYCATTHNKPIKIVDVKTYPNF